MALRLREVLGKRFFNSKRLFFVKEANCRCNLDLYEAVVYIYVGKGGAWLFNFGRLFCYD